MSKMLQKLLLVSLLFLGIVLLIPACSIETGLSNTPPQSLLDQVIQHYLNGSATEAIDILKQTEISDPDNPTVLSNLGSLYVLTDQWQEGIDTLQKIPDDPWAQAILRLLTANRSD